MPTRWRWRIATSSSRTASRRSRPKRVAPPASWPSGPWVTSVPRATSTTPCGMPTPMRRSWRTRPIEAVSRRSGANLRRATPCGTPVGLVCCPDSQLLPALHAGELGPDCRCVGRGQPHVRVPHRRSRVGPAHRRGLRVPTSTPILWWRRASRPASLGSTTNSSCPIPTSATHMRPTTYPVSPPPWSKPSPVRDSTCRARGVRPRGAPPPLEHRRPRMGRLEPSRLGLGAGPLLRAHLRERSSNIGLLSGSSSACWPDRREPFRRLWMPLVSL